MRLQCPPEGEIVDTGPSINLVAEDKAIVVFCFPVPGACGIAGVKERARKVGKLRDASPRVYAKRTIMYQDIDVSFETGRTADKY